MNTQRASEVAHSRGWQLILDLDLVGGCSAGIVDHSANSWPPEHGSVRVVELFIWQLASPRMRKPRLMFHGLLTLEILIVLCTLID